MSTTFEALQHILVFPDTSSQYQEARTLLESEQLDNNSATVLKRFGLDLKATDSITKIPNIFSKVPNLHRDNSKNISFTHLSDCLDELAKNSPPQLYPSILEYLETLLSSQLGQETFSLEIILLIIPILLNAHDFRNYVNEGDNRKTVSSFLSSRIKPIALESFKTELQQPLLFLREILNNYTNRYLRLRGREICQALRVPLELPKMISLSVDGTTSNPYPIEQDDMVLVIGTTGAGKSTAINYLSGIEYNRIKVRTTGNVYLHPNPGQKTPSAKVGHTSISETLFPQIIFSDGIDFTDCPGWDENRLGNEGICSSLGVPIAAQSALKRGGKIRAVLLTLEWGSLYAGKGEGFKKLIDTLYKIFDKAIKEDITKTEPRIPILFAVTKLPAVEEGEEFDAALLREQFVNKTAALKRDYQQVHLPDITTFRKELGELEKKLSYLKKFRERFLSFNVTKGREREHGFFDKVIQRGGEIAAAIRGNRQDRIRQIAEEQLNIVWGQEDRLEEPYRSRFLSAIRELVLTCSSHGHEIAYTERTERFIDQKIKEWESEAESTLTRQKDLRNQIGILESQEVIYDLILRNLKANGIIENIFMLRGYKSKPDDNNDHREELLHRLQELRTENKEILPQDFAFDPEDKEFTAVRKWTESNVAPLLKLGDYLSALPEGVEEKSKKIEEKHEEIKKQEEQIRARFAKRQLVDGTSTLPEHESGELGLLTKAITAREHAIKYNTRKLQKQRDDLALKEQAILDIRQAPPVEYNSKLIDYKQDPFSRWWGRQTSDIYNFEPDAGLLEWLSSLFWTRSERITIPISYVELSCVVDRDDKLISELDRCVRVVLGQIKQVELKSDDKLTGEFEIIARDLSNGDLKVKYTSKKGGDAKAKIRVFVPSEHEPKNKAKLKSLEEEKDKIIKECTRLEQEIQTQLQSQARDNAYLVILKSSEGVSKQESIARITSLWERVGGDKDKFLHLFPANIQEHLEWLIRQDNSKPNDHCLDLISRLSERECVCRYNMKRDTLKILLGEKAPVVTKELTEPEVEKLNQIPKKFIPDMYQFFTDNGWSSIDSLRELLRYVQKETKQGILNRDIEVLTQRKLVEEYYFTQLKDIYVGQRYKIDAINIIGELLEFTEGSDVHKFALQQQTIENIITINNYPKLTADSVGALNEALNDWDYNLYRACMKMYGVLESTVSTEERHNPIPAGLTAGPGDKIALMNFTFPYELAEYYGFVVQPVFEYGDCQFRAIADQLNLQGRKRANGKEFLVTDDSWEELRQSTVEHLEQHKEDLYRDYLDHGGKISLLEQVKLDGKGNKLTLHAMATILNSSIIVIPSDGTRPLVYKSVVGGGGENPPIVLGHVANSKASAAGLEYQSLRPAIDIKPALIARGVQLPAGLNLLMVLQQEEERGHLVQAPQIAIRLGRRSAQSIRDQTPSMVIRAAAEITPDPADRHVRSTAVDEADDDRHSQDQITDDATIDPTDRKSGGASVAQVIGYSRRGAAAAVSSRSSSSAAAGPADTTGFDIVDECPVVLGAADENVHSEAEGSGFQMS